MALKQSLLCFTIVIFYLKGLQDQQKKKGMFLIVVVTLVPFQNFPIPHHYASVTFVMFWLVLFMQLIPADICIVCTAITLHSNEILQ